jgi:acyl carrier protein
MNSQLAKRIKNVMSAVFELSADEITDHSSPDTIWSWDSLKHMNLVSALEEEFDISFTDSEILEIMNFPLIKLIISEKISLLL